MNYFPNIIQFIHLFSAIIWLGGMFFIALVLVPTLKNLENPKKRVEIVSQVAKRFRVVSWICIILLLITGVSNLINRGINVELITTGKLFSTYFGKILATKVLLVLLMIVLSFIHDFIIGPRLSKNISNEEYSTNSSIVYIKNRRLVIFLARLNALLAVSVVCLAVFLT